jgi:uncharacterized protein
MRGDITMLKQIATGPVVYLFLLVLGSSTVSGQTADRPRITVSGQAEVMVVPDEVAFNLSVVTTDKDLLSAQKRNDEVVKRVLALARDYKIPETSVQTGHISLDEKFTDEEATRKPPVFLGYEVTKQIAIILRDVTKAESMLADIFKSGVTRIASVEFRSTQTRKYKDQARALAIKAAQEKANALAKEIGQTIGKAYTITEDGVIPYSNYAANTIRGRGFAGEFSDAESTVALGQISVTAKVLVSFELK